MGEIPHGRAGRIRQGFRTMLPPTEVNSMLINTFPYKRIKHRKVPPLAIPHRRSALADRGRSHATAHRHRSGLEPQVRSPELGHTIRALPVGRSSRCVKSVSRADRQCCRHWGVRCAGSRGGGLFGRSLPVWESSMIGGRTLSGRWGSAAYPARFCPTAAPRSCSAKGPARGGG
jgi:hypothetical protein